MTETYEKIRAGRALLDWSQEDLARDSGVDRTTIVQIEQAKSRPQQATMDKIESALNRGGVFFTDSGVEKRDTYTQSFSGANWYLDLLDDALTRLQPGDEIVIFYADERKSPPEVIERMRQIKAKGIHSRLFIEEGNTFIQGDLPDYRYIPKKLFDNYYFILYGDRIGLTSDNSAVAIHDARLAKNWRSIVEIMWQTLETPAKSTADVKI